MRHPRKLALAGAVAATSALLVPAAALGHGSVFRSTAKVIPEGSPPPATSAGLQDQVQYVVTNHGFTYVIRESNGLDSDEGMLNFKAAPGAYRNQPGFEDGEPAGERARLRRETDTGAQPHATCDVPALREAAAILAWQGADPFYNYVPFQPGSAGLQDDPSLWIPVVQAATGVDLTSTADPEAACEALPGATGTSYHAADALVTSAAALAEGQTVPLEEEIGTLTAGKAAAEKAASDATTRATTAEAAASAARSEAQKLMIATTPLGLSMADVKARSAGKRGATVSVTGAPLKTVTVQLRIGKAAAKKLGLKSRTLGSKSGVIGPAGTASLKVKPSKAAAKALRRLKSGSVKLTVTGLAGDRATTSGTLTR